MPIAKPPLHVFQSTPSGGKATGAISAIVWTVSWFQSTPSGGKATSRYQAIRIQGVFKSTPSGGKATLLPVRPPTVEIVSIHAFRGEGDSTLM